MHKAHKIAGCQQQHLLLSIWAIRQRVYLDGHDLWPPPGLRAIEFKQDYLTIGVPVLGR